MRISRIYPYIICFLFTITTAPLLAQEPISTAEVETKSLQLYTQKNWAALIPFVKQALAEGNDYFYLRMRIGIAYYENKNFTRSEEQFKKALGFNSSDQLAQEYLYYSYIFNGKPEEARLMSKAFSPELKTKTGTDNASAVSFFFAEGGTKIADSSRYYNTTTKTRSNYYNNALYFQAGLGHYVGKQASLMHAITYFKQDAQQINVTQFQYYLKGAFPLKKNWIFSPSLHWVNLSNTIDLTNAAPQVPPGAPMPPARTQTVKSVNNYFVGSFLLQKRMNNLTLGLGATFSNMGDTTQIIHSGFISVAPLGNTRFIMGATVYMHTLNSYSTINYSYVPFLYFEPFSKLSVKLSYLANQKDNIVEENGYLINNSIDFTKSRFSVLLNGTVSRHLTVYGLYQSEQKQEPVQKLNYKYNVFVAGLKFAL